MNYFLDTPIKKGVYIPEEIKQTPVPQHTSNQTQDHRIFQWLHHKPQAHAIFSKPAQSGREKK
jgi:hypothetical protein